jgi:hypothetical protein
MSETFRTLNAIAWMEALLNEELLDPPPQQEDDNEDSKPPGRNPEDDSFTRLAPTAAASNMDYMNIDIETFLVDPLPPQQDDSKLPSFNSIMESPDHQPWNNTGEDDHHRPVHIERPTYSTATATTRNGNDHHSENYEEPLFNIDEDSLDMEFDLLQLLVVPLIFDPGEISPVVGRKSVAMNNGVPHPHNISKEQPTPRNKVIANPVPLNTSYPTNESTCNIILHRAVVVSVTTTMGIMNSTRPRCNSNQHT